MQRSFLQASHDWSTLQAQVVNMNALCAHPRALLTQVLHQPVCHITPLSVLSSSMQSSSWQRAGAVTCCNPSGVLCAYSYSWRRLGGSCNACLGWGTSSCSLQLIFHLRLLLQDGVEPCQQAAHVHHCVTAPEAPGKSWICKNMQMHT